MGRVFSFLIFQLERLQPNFEDSLWGQERKLRERKVNIFINVPTNCALSGIQKSGAELYFFHENVNRLGGECARKISRTRHYSGQPSHFRFHSQGAALG